LPALLRRKKTPTVKDAKVAKQNLRISLWQGQALAASVKR